MFFHTYVLDQVWSILAALELLPLNFSRRTGQWGRNSNESKMDQTWEVVVKLFERLDQQFQDFISFESVYSFQRLASRGSLLLFFMAFVTYKTFSFVLLH